VKNNAKKIKKTNDRNKTKVIIIRVIRTHPVNLSLKVQIPRWQQSPDIQSIPFPVLESCALVIQRILSWSRMNGLE